MTEDQYEEGFDPRSPEQIQAMLRMVEYLLPQARAVSADVARYLDLAQIELAKVQMVGREAPPHHAGLQ